ncbi:DUF58 domain-containing protein [Actinomyces timonensis]|uniref:DUF58 domain-containing protein n=1 Tax=Actinomyces timonensis TaxID=1288391 RepID=A0AAU8N1W6_9ACTO
MPTSHGWEMLALALLLALAGWATRLALLMRAGLLLAILMLLCLLMAMALGALAAPRARLLGPEEIIAGQPGAWAIEGRSRLIGALPAWLRWEIEHLPRSASPAGGIAPHGQRRFTGPLRAVGRSSAADRGESLISSLTITGAERGALRLEARWLLIHEPFGLARARVPIRAASHVLVLPRPAALPEGVAVGAGSASWGRSAHRERGSAQRGGEQICRLRDYLPGDPLTSIHWRQSARQGGLVVAERDRVPRPRRSLALRLAATAPSGARGRAGAAEPRDGVEESERAERAISVAAALITAWAEQGCAVDLDLGGEASDGPSAGPSRGPSAGPDGVAGSAPGQGLALLRRLAVVGPADARASAAEHWGARGTGAPDALVTDSPALAARAGRELPEASAIILIGDDGAPTLRTDPPVGGRR